MSRDDDEPMRVAPRRPRDCLSDLVLDRLIANESVAGAWEHVEGCARCRGRIDELRRVERVSDEWVRAATGRARSTLRWRRATTLSTLAAAAALLFVFGRGALRPVPVEVERAKGDAFSLAIYVRHQDGKVAAPTSPAAVAPGEQIRFEVQTARPGRLGVVGVDAAGQVSAYVSDGNHLRPIGAGRHLLDGSIRLDDTPGDERLIALLCGDERSTEEVLAAARRALADAHGDPGVVGALPIACRQASFLLHKAPPARP
jgi:hypothetical protein